MTTSSQLPFPWPAWPTGNLPCQEMKGQMIVNSSFLFSFCHAGLPKPVSLVLNSPGGKHLFIHSNVSHTYICKALSTLYVHCPIHHQNSRRHSSSSSKSSHTTRSLLYWAVHSCYPVSLQAESGLPDYSSTMFRVPLIAFGRNPKLSAHRSGTST